MAVQQFLRRCALLAMLGLAVSLAHAGTLESLTAGDEAGLASSLGQVQNAFEEGRLDEYQLRNAFRPFYKLDPQQTKTLMHWARESPDVYVAQLAIGIYFKRQADEQRGTDSIGNTNTVLLSEAAESRKIALGYLEHSRSLTKEPYLSIFHLLEVEGSTGQDAWPLVLAANEMLPSNVLVRCRYVKFRTPRWGGSYEEIDQFIRYTRQSDAPESVLDGMQAIEYDDMGDTLARQNDPAQSELLYLAALRLAEHADPGFAVDWLGYSRNKICIDNTASYCKGSS